MSRLTRLGPHILPCEIIDPPLIANAYDDEFNGAALDASWVRSGTFDDVNAIDPYATFNGAAGLRWNHNGMRPSWYLMQGSANSAIPNIHKVIVTPTNAFYYWRLSFNVRNASKPAADSLIGCGLYTSAASGFNRGFFIQMNTGDLSNTRLGVWNNSAGVDTNLRFTVMAGAMAGQGGQAFHIVGIQKLGTTYHAWAMTAAGAWMWLASGVNAATFVTCPIYVQNSSIVAPGNMITGVDFFRVKNGSNLP